ncbi:hypothetical protein ACTVZO_00530 [Streptomyces sp. IBSNAI002]|uniref:hypothetical protein n=1 Tax=Streptomyces sp. IBSNAI002 TaxID=3457500 RepID=UPI003FD5FDE5
MATAPVAVAAQQALACVPFGTAGLADMPSGGTAGLAELPAAPLKADLPDDVHFRSTQASFNRIWAFALIDGRIYVKPRDQQGGWRVVPLPDCLNGQVAGISVDDDELLATNRAGALYTMDHALTSPRMWNWTSRYGTPLWLGGGHRLPPNAIDWSWSVISAREDQRWRDGFGNDHHIEPAKVSQVYALTGDGSRIVYMDPWLPNDHSYEVRSPLGGRFQAVKLSASGSTVFVTNRFGDLYTRQYDFDMSGANTVFFRYSYEDQRGLPAAPDLLSAYINHRYAAVQLPAQEWKRQPKVPGQISDRISIHKTGPGPLSRQLRVEGLQDGRTGFWTKDLAASSWTFVPTDQPLQRPLMANPPEDRSSDTLAPAAPSYAGAEADYVADVDGFHVASGATPLTVRFASGASLELVLHTVDALRQIPRAAGLDETPRAYTGAVEIPPTTRLTLEQQPSDVRAFVARELGTRRFTTTDVVVTRQTMRIAALDLSLDAR